MTNDYRNIPIQGLIDLLGQQSENCKTCSGKTLLVGKPAFNDGGESAQTEVTPQVALRRATTYATFARNQDTYVNKAHDKTVTPYTIAISDWFCAPTVLLVSVDAWTGRPGQTIRVKARDNIRVASVTIVIRDEEGNVLETGEAVSSKAGNTWWKYTTKVSISMKPFPRVEATARDLAGNQNTFILC